MVTSRLLSGLLTALLTSCAAAAIGLTPGKLELSLVFPLNDTYEPQVSSWPLVFALSLQPFQPALVSMLQLELDCDLLDLHEDYHNGTGILTSMWWWASDFNLSSSSVDKPYFFAAYGRKSTGLESQFQLECLINMHASFLRNDSNNKPYMYTDRASILIDTYFTTRSGAKAADIPSKAGNGATTCVPHGGWTVEFNVSNYTVSNYIDIESNTYPTFPILAPSPTASQLPCATEVDALTAASISAGVAVVNSLQSGVAGTLPVSWIVVTAWSLLMFGLSAVLFVC